MITNKKFGECLRFLLSTLGISINRLSKAINVDSSLVNRWINEKRIPSYNTTYIESIAEYLSKSTLNSFQEQYLNELFFSVCGNYELNLSIKDKIKRILLQAQGYSIECHKTLKRESKARSISNKETSAFPNNYQFGFQLTTYASFPFINLSSEDKIIIGCRNVLFTGISLLEAAASHRCDNNDTIYISFNNDVDMTSYHDSGLIYWKNAVLKAINNGWNVLYLLRLDNDIKRAIQFINFAQAFMNTGKFNPYYLKKYDVFTTGKDFIIVPELGSLLCLSGSFHSEIDSAFYFKNKVAVNILKNNFNTIISNFAQPLIKYYTQDNTLEYGYCLAESEESIGNRFMFKYDISSLMLPENLYAKFLQIINLSHDEMLTALYLYERRLKAFLSNIHNYEYKDIYLRDCIDNLIKYRKFNLYFYNGVEIINLEIQDIIELLQNIISLLQRYNNYNIAFIYQNTNNAIQLFNFYCLVKERKIVLMESRSPSKTIPQVRLSIEEPMLVKAFEEYWKEIWEQIAPVNKDKNEIINWIQCQINSLKKTV